MRTLKFRAWSNEHNRYCDFVTLDENGRWIGWIKSSGVYLTTVDIVLEQYTGLKDKNGKEIYEGDIIHRGAIPKVNIFRNSIISFDEEKAGFVATSIRGGYNVLFNSHICSEIQVIGNIHENKELLEGEK